MEFRLLGPLDVRLGDRPVAIGGRKQRQLLAILLVNANSVVSTDRLIDELWAESPPETAATALQVYVSKLRKVLPSETLLTRPPGYVLEVDPESIDVRRFEHLVREASAALARGDAGGGAAMLHESLRLWRGSALAEFAFDAFAQPEITRLEELRLVAVEERIEADLALGRHAEVVGELEALLGQHPFRERLRAQLVLALYRCGRQAEALKAFQGARRALVDELGLEPSARLQRLERAILTQSPELDLRAPEARAVLAGERRLVTVLFADLGVDAAGAEDPERARELLARVYAAVDEEVAAAGGTLERGLAGAVMVTFGAPVPQRDHAARALRTALAIRRRLADLVGEPLTFRAGIETGDVVVGEPGESGSFVIGEPVTAAARLIRGASPGDILVGPRAALEAADEFAFAGSAAELRASGAQRLEGARTR